LHPNTDPKKPAYIFFRIIARESNKNHPKKKEQRTQIVSAREDRETERAERRAKERNTRRERIPFKNPSHDAKVQKREKKK